MIKKHLSRFESIIKKSSDNAPYLHRPKTANDFVSAKIVAPQRSLYNKFGYNKIPWYASADVYFITNRNNFDINLKYILALLNSKIYYFWLYYKGKRKGEMLELLYQPLTEIPIKIISNEKQQLFIEFIDKILTIAKSPDYLQNILFDNLYQS